MKKLKLFLLLFAAAVASVGFTSCNDDDDDAASIVGSWISAESDENMSDIMTFTADGIWMCQYKEYAQSGTEYGVYTYDGSTLAITYEDGDFDTIPVSISGDTMIFDEDEVFIRM